ncbi:MAG: hypothetical protein M1834_007284 [Cirrosporium novae-zelandiae]|nr:MAG: hypothetical protein M1834_007284 [Cirrosporium novae-zelandiae]
METSEPEGFRTRFGSYAPAPPPLSRMQSSETHHGYALPPPAQYNQPPPPSPYENVNSEHPPNLPEPTTHPYSSTIPGYATPGRDPHQYPPSENAYGRPGNSQAPPRIPNDVQHPPQPFRSMNGISPDGPHHPQIQPGDYRGQPGFPSYEGPPPGGPPHGLPSSGPHEGMSTGPSPSPGGAYPPPPTPVTHPGQSPYDNNNVYHPHLVSAPYPQQRRRPVRAAQACENCRQRKAKCDEQRPCSSCKEAQQQCVYRDVPPAKQEKTQLAILDELKKIQARMDHFERVQQSILSAVQSRGLLDPQASPAYGSHGSSGTPQYSPPVSGMSQVIKKPNSPQGAPLDNLIHHEPKQEMPTRTNGNNDIDSDAAQDLVSIPADHTTAASKLLRWPKIKEMVPPGLETDYVMEGELDRGSLKLFGRGEGKISMESIVSNPENSFTSVKTEDTQSSSSDGSWGTEFFGPASLDVSQKEVAINNDGTLRLDIYTITCLVNSYKSNIHILHPILELKTLQKMVSRFKARYNPSAEKASRSSFAVGGGYSNAGSPREYGPRAAKRKRSSEDLQSPELRPNTNPMNGSVQVQSMFDMSIDTAIVLLVLALGQICEVKGRIPGPVPDNGHIIGTPSDRSDSPMQADYSPQPFPKQSPASTSSPLNPVAPSPLGTFRVNSAPGAIPRRSNFEIAQKNIEVIPGLGYFAMATKILGTLFGTHELALIQAYLLAGLYVGQLARVGDSWHWINMACIECRILIDKFYGIQKDAARKDLIEINFWSCLQLESDILAEMDLPASNITSLEQSVKKPAGYTLEIFPDSDLSENDPLIMLHFLAQISLRKLLNSIHSTLYRNDIKSKSRQREKWTSQLSEALSLSLEDWRKTLPVQLQWQDDAPPANNINDARLRGKYYGAKYIIYRPFLHHALQQTVPNFPESPVNSKVHSSRPSPSLGPRKNSDMGPPHKIPPPSTEGVHDKILEACYTCVEAAFQSTIAFDGVRTTIGEDRKWSRPIVTNIFGTAHAQFGNLLVLTATHRSHLSSLVPKERLNPLLSRTIHFLRMSSRISPTLRKDAEILDHIQNNILQWPTDKSLIMHSV